MSLEDLSNIFKEPSTDWYSSLNFQLNINYNSQLKIPTGTDTLKSEYLDYVPTIYGNSYELCRYLSKCKKIITYTIYMIQQIPTAFIMYICLIL